MIDLASNAPIPPRSASTLLAAAPAASLRRPRTGHAWPFLSRPVPRRLATAAPDKPQVDRADHPNVPRRSVPPPHPRASFQSAPAEGRP